MADNFDMRAHKQTYEGFMTLLKWSSIGIAILMVVLVGWVF